VLESTDPAVLLPELLPFICQTDAFFKHAVDTSAGSLSPRTNWTSLANFMFALPPIEEQRALVRILRASTESSETLEDALNAAYQVVQAFKNSLIKPDDASVCRDYLLGDLLTGSPESGCSAPQRDTDTGHFVLGLAALSRNGYQSGDFKPVDPTKKMLAAKLGKGDLLISRSNTVDRVGFAGIFDDVRDNVSFPDTMMRLKPNIELIEPQYLEAILQTSAAREFLMRIAAGTSASMKKINRANLLKMPMKVLPLDQQRESVRRLNATKLAVSSLQARLAAARQLAIQLATDSLHEGR
jgi:type I restriction enzyme S subunit